MHPRVETDYSIFPRCSKTHFRKRREDGDHPLLNHYVHKDGFFLRGREDLLSRIVRSGANRDPTECENNYDASLGPRSYKYTHAIKCII